VPCIRGGRMPREPIEGGGRQSECDCFLGANIRREGSQKLRKASHSTRFVVSGESAS